MRILVSWEAGLTALERSRGGSANSTKSASGPIRSK